MARQKDYTLYLDRIIEAMKKSIKRFSTITFEEMKNDELIFVGGVKYVENIGEAANRIPPSIKEKYVHLEIPWKDIREMRNKLVHEYDNILMPKLWKTIKEDIPRDLPKIQEMRRLEEQRMKKVRKREERERDGMEG